MKKVVIFLIIIFGILIYLEREKIIVSVGTDEKIIYLDPGHGGADGGVCVGDIYEKDIVLKVTLYLKLLLEGEGYIVCLTRTGDYDLASKNSNNRKREDIRKRVAMINNSNANLFLSIHVNGYPSSIVYGSQTFYRPNDSKSKQLAEMIQSSFKNVLKNTKRDALVINDKYLIDNTTKIGCLIEIGYLTNPQEKMLLIDDNYLMKVATAIMLGVLNFHKCCGNY